MSRLNAHPRFWFALAMALGVAGAPSVWGKPVASRAPLQQLAEPGEFGGDMRWLARYYTPPQAPGENNHYLDMGGKGVFQDFLREQGLTNNRAFFVVSHGIAWNTPQGMRYAYYPDDRVFTGKQPPRYSARDLARLLGPAAAAGIHNLVIAGCNSENQFNSAELRHYFVNATNITHAQSWSKGYMLSFRHALLYQSKDISFLYEMPDNFAVGAFAQHSGSPTDSDGIKPYVADLYRPGEAKPYTSQTAGRELLTQSLPMIFAQASSSPRETRTRTASSVAVPAAPVAPVVPAPVASAAPRIAKDLIIRSSRKESTVTAASAGGIFSGQPGATGTMLLLGCGCLLLSLLIWRYLRCSLR